MASLHQFVPTFEPGAVGAHMLHLQHLLRDECGLRSEIFAEHVSPAMVGRASSYQDYDRGPYAQEDDVLVYQMAIGSPVADFLRARPERLVVNHHGLTPSSTLRRWDPGATGGVLWGQEQLRGLAGRAELGIADSRFNQGELVRAGYVETVVAPIMVDLEAFDLEVDAGVLAALEEDKEAGGADWLFVGRVAPNKCQHDVIKAFAAFRQLYDDKARLHLVGGCSSPRYWSALEQYVADLGLTGVVRLTGQVPPGILAAHFRAADVFVCLSEHEGFCVPLLEAMHHRLPIVAFAATAVPETLGDAGLRLGDKSPLMVAAAANRALGDEGLRAALATAAERRLAGFTFQRCQARWLHVLRKLSVVAP